MSLVDPFASGIQGHVDLTIEAGGAFLEGSLKRMSARLDAPGGTLGRSPDATLVIHDPNERVSRTHAVIRLEGSLWAVRDWRSLHGTIVSCDGVRTDLPYGASELLVAGMRLLLARDLQIRVDEVEVVQRGSGTVTKSEGLRVLPPLLEGSLRDFACALCAPYRERPPRAEPAVVEEVATELHIGRRTAYNRLKALCEMPHIAGRLEGVTQATRTRRLAAVLVEVYPELAERGVVR